ncbi:biotin--[acetyl-CoA-carboxylase] ligase [Quisquiliibacterium transsilvanicum]|uniref:biotin--[biotin carboxyl-carrier protein] ligase n=1 Tax=Quisquiliibacterium transsilvanicum TaxID=1549638 RepID=A0A7W8HI48_9BURK|nr:BirA family biotin operon repressor/biotin-[acetyl-CoA-carboxylase] ligase [Quisquiliibacterium transsilvanicum]
MASPDQQTQQPGRSAAADAGLDAALIAAAAALPESCVEVVDSIDSTNKELMRRPAGPPRSGGAPAVHVLLAVQQVAGRGRRGRVFVSDPLDSLTFSVAIDHCRGAHTPALVGLPLALGVAVAKTASAWAPGIGLKWPNDLLRKGLKCAGMLVETRLSGEHERIVIGLGVNLRLPDALASAIDQPACGLFEAGSAMPPREELAGRLARALIDAAERFLAEGFGDTALQWAPFDVLAGREVTILEDGRPKLSGRADGLDPTGALRLRTSDGVVAVAVGDVSARLSDLTGARGP